MTALDNRPTCSYPGDVTSDVGRVVGPNTTGEYLVMEEATYDPATGLTTARFRYARPADVTPNTSPLGGIR